MKLGIFDIKQTPVQMYNTYIKVLNIIQSCTTYEHYLTAYRVVENYRLLYPKDILSERLLAYIETQLFELYNEDENSQSIYSGMVFSL